MMIRRHVFDKVKFNESLMNHQRDDVEFCHRAWDAGFSLSIFPEAFVTHHLDPAGRSDDDPAAGSNRFAEGIYNYRMGRYSEALDNFWAVMDDEPVKSRYHAALCLKELESYDQAVDELKFVIKNVDIDDMNERRLFYSAHFHLGDLLEKAGLNEKASECYSKTLEGFGEHHEASLGLKRVKGKYK